MSWTFWEIFSSLMEWEECLEPLSCWIDFKLQIYTLCLKLAFPRSQLWEKYLSSRSLFGEWSSETETGKRESDGKRQGGQWSVFNDRFLRATEPQSCWEQSCPTQGVRKPECLSTSSHEALFEHCSQGVFSLSTSCLLYTWDENMLVARESLQTESHQRWPAESFGTGYIRTVSSEGCEWALTVPVNLHN